MAYPNLTPEELTTEEWRDVVGFEGYYKVSNLGRVMSNQYSPGRTHVGRILIPLRWVKRKEIYYRIDLRAPGKKARPYIHQLVAAAFIGPCPDGLEISHMDNDSSNNRSSNLEYWTHKRNMEYASESGRMPTGLRNHKTKLTEQDIPIILKLIADGMRDYSIAKQFSVNSGAIRNVRHGISWKHVRL